MEKLELDLFSESNDEELNLEKIKGKKIISVTIAYLAKEEKETFQRTLTIEDKDGLSLTYDKNNPSCLIGFTKENALGKLGNFMKDSLIIFDLKTIRNRFQIGFHVENLKAISWLS